MIYYVDVNPIGFFEDYSIQPKRYGGGAVFARWMKEYRRDFHIYAQKPCFDNLADFENHRNCHVITEEQRQSIVNGKPLQNVIHDLDSTDLVLTHNPAVYFNTEDLIPELYAPQAAWCVGYLDTIHPKQTNLLLYNEYQHPKITNPDTKTFKISIGKPIPPFRSHQKERFIFQCSRQCDLFNSTWVAEVCRRNNIPAIFAGPLDKDCRLLDFVDGGLINYLGEISETEKIELYKRARLTTLIHNWPTPFSLSAVESLSYGTPVACAHIGFWPSLIKEGKNGFFIKSEKDLLEAYAKSLIVFQEDCYSAAEPFDQYQMCDSVERACKYILGH